MDARGKQWHRHKSPAQVSVVAVEREHIFHFRPSARALTHGAVELLLTLPLDASVLVQIGARGRRRVKKRRCRRL